jgi:uncharacterized membrane protein
MSASPHVEESHAQNGGKPRADASLGSSEHFRWLKGIVKWLLVLNLCDAVFTLIWVRSGLAIEANTLLDELVNDHAVIFVATKLGLVSMGSWVLWQRRDRPLAVIAIFIAFVIYYLLLLYHVQYASGLIRELLFG